MEIRVPKELYSAATVLKAAYAFLENSYIHIGDGGEEWVISWRMKDSSQPDTNLSAEFENELIANAVREHVIRQTKTIREIIMARAMTSTVIDTEDPLERIAGDNSDISNEELGSILTNWFDKNG